MTRATTHLIGWAGSVLALAGCTGMAGTGGSSSYSCQAPEGVTCNSVSGVYANAIRNNLPHQARAAASSPALPSASAPRVIMPTPAVERPSVSEDLRSRPRVLRLWFKAWEDADNDLFDQGYVYVRVDAGHWRLDHVQRQARDRFAPLRPPVRGEAPAYGSEPKGPLRPSPDAPPELRQLQRPGAPRAGTE